jgi:hypothetical protein
MPEAADIRFRYKWGRYFMGKRFFFSREAGGVLLAGRGPSPGGVSSVAEVLPAASREVCFHRANSINMA